MQDDGQAALIAFLERPEAYPHRPESVERIDTHGAAIFLAGPLAYKLKRAVKLSYLDFSTLALREAACRREMELNQPAAPALYRRLVPVTRGPDGAYRLDGGGAPVDWLVEMARFGQDQLLDAVAKRGELDDALADALADLVAASHAAAPSVRTALWPASLGAVIGTLGDMLQRWRSLSGRDDAGLHAALQEAFAANAELLAARREAGFVRRCHADLHLRNIVLIDGRPCLFDALEFDEELARIDVLYDLGFLLMDLWRRGLTPQANRLMGRYAAGYASEAEWRGLRVLPLFMTIRAAIRAMVALDALPVAGSDRRDALMAEIAGYIALSEAMIQPRPPRLVAIGGLSGTGKSTAARAVAPEIGAAPGAIILRTDAERKSMRDAPPTERLAGDAYSREARAEVYRRLFAKAKLILRAGHSVILDAVFDEPALRQEASGAAAECGASFAGFWLDAPKDALVARVSARTGDASDADAAVVLRQIATTTPPDDWRKTDASGDPAQTAEHIRQALASTDGLSR